MKYVIKKINERVNTLMEGKSISLKMSSSSSKILSSRKENGFLRLKLATIS
jgi:hypothetical protein